MLISKEETNISLVLASMTIYMELSKGFTALVDLDISTASKHYCEACSVYTNYLKDSDYTVQPEEWKTIHELNNSIDTLGERIKVMRKIA